MQFSFPAGLRAAAHEAGNGELLWPAERAAEVASWLAAQDRAIWGGEVFQPRGEFTAVLLDEWRTIPGRDEDGDWAGYVQRGRDQALDAIAAHAGDASMAEGLLFFFAHEGRDGFRG